MFKGSYKIVQLSGFCHGWLQAAVKNPPWLWPAVAVTSHSVERVGWQKVQPCRVQTSTHNPRPVGEPKLTPLNVYSNNSLTNKDIVFTLGIPLWTSIPHIACKNRVPGYNRSAVSDVRVTSYPADLDKN